jgi:cytochrome c oxidase subunit 3
VSVALQLALRSIRKNEQLGLRRWLKIGGALAIGFLCVQAFNWREIQHLNPTLESRQLSQFTFYLLTGVHALHVLGGFVPLGIVHYRALQREYSSSRYDGVRFCVQYWHYLLVVWMLLLVTMVAV